ncbi:MAG: hypothetical protein FJ290_16295 [Planctomycetes bacterium]|nr:hypothetical protein [Planctomycetota bacterium]
MPFLLYTKTPNADGSHEFLQLRTLSLAGKGSGLIQPFVAKYGPGAPPFAWHATAGDLLEEAHAPRKGYGIVVDLKPRVKGNVSLFELTDVWGYSYAEWTPLALRMESLWTDIAASDPDRYKQRFNDQGSRRERVHQFLYLQGGVGGGGWGWGPVGSVNGVLLWPDAMEYFLSRIRPSGP